MFDQYCFLCGLPFYKPHEGIVTRITDFDSIDLEWLNGGVGFDKTRNATVVIKCDDNYGRFEVHGNDRDFMCVEPYDQDPKCTYVGVVCHHDCHEFVKKTLKSDVNAQKMTKICAESQSSLNRDYRSQIYEWQDAYDTEGPSYFYSPMSKDGGKVRERILRCIYPERFKPREPSVSDRVRAFRIEDDVRFALEIVDATCEDFFDRIESSIQMLREVLDARRDSNSVTKLRDVGFAVGSILIENAQFCDDAINDLDRANLVRENPELWVQRIPKTTGGFPDKTIKPKKSPRKLRSLKPR